MADLLPLGNDLSTPLVEALRLFLRYRFMSRVFRSPRRPAAGTGSAPGTLPGLERAQHAELVAVRVGQDHPADLGALPHVGAPRAESLKPRHFGGLVGRPQVEVQPVL